MNAPSQIRTASPDQIDEMIAIDDDASTLFVEAGLDSDLSREHPYCLAERASWLRCAREGRVYLAGAPGEPAEGLLVLDWVDGAPYLEQLSVRRRAMGRGLGRRLLYLAIAWAAGKPLWLTTYAHLPWNRPFYERHGFIGVAPSDCGPGMAGILEEQRRALPAPEHRLAMKRSAGIR